jgi:AraC-like DNA-binding protein
VEGITFCRDPALPFLEAKLCQVKTLSYKKHFHEEYSIGIIDEGHSRVWCDGKYLEVGAGRLISIPPLLPHACNPDEKSDWTYKMLFIHPDWISRALGEEWVWNGSYFFHEEINRTCSVLLNRLIGLLKHGAAPLATETLAIRFMEAAIERRRSLLGMPEESRETKEEKKLLLVRDYLHEHFLEKVTLEELENVSGLSRYRIIRLFNQQHRLPPHAYQNLLRVNYAKKLLHPEKPLADAAMEAGFYDQSHFTRMFKHCVGVTPQKYVNSL